MSNVAKPMKTEFFPKVRPNRGWSFFLGVSIEDGHFIGCVKRG